MKRLEALSPSVSPIGDKLSRSTQNTPVKPLSDKEIEIITALDQFQTLDELKKAVGPLTPEEQAIFTNPHLFDDPTPEEIAALGPGFIERVIQKTMDRIHKLEKK